MQLLCPKCHQPIVGADIDLARGIGVCRPCGEIVSLQGAKPSADMALAPSGALGTIAVYRPENFRFDEQSVAGAYQVGMPPNRLSAIPTLFFTLFWDTFMIVWYTIAIRQHVWPMALFGLIHLGVGVWMTHQSLVALFNTARFSIANGRVRFANGPVPTRGALDVALEAIDGFVVIPRTTNNGNGPTTYPLIANFSNGTSKELSFALSDNRAAEFAAARFNEELAAAKAVVPTLPYR